MAVTVSNGNGNGNGDTGASRLRCLELRVRSEACALEWLLEQSMELTLKIMAGRERLADSIRELEEFKATLQGVSGRRTADRLV